MIYYASYIFIEVFRVVVCASRKVCGPVWLNGSSGGRVGTIGGRSFSGHPIAIELCIIVGRTFAKSLG